MWHLQKKYSGESLAMLFHTLDDVAAFILSATTLYEYCLVFVPIWQPPEPSAEQAEPETPFKFPEPLSGTE
jgi:hypothetical protein